MIIKYMNMTFLEAFKFYFTKLFDLTSYITLFCFIVTIFLLIYKKPKKIWDLIIMIALSLLGGGIISLIDGVCFGLVISKCSDSNTANMLFPLCKSLIVFLIACLVYFKDRPIQLSIKLSTLVSSICIINTISKSLGFFAGVSSGDNYYFVSFSRSFPNLFLIVTVLIIKKFDINHFRTLSKELVIAMYVTNCVLIAIALYDSTLDEHGLSINILISFISITLFALMILLYYALFKVNEYRQKSTNSEVQEKLAVAKLKSLEIDKVNREEINKVKHDIKNQISYIGLLLEQKKYEEASKYIGEYIEKNDEILNTFVSPNEVINSIVNLELTKAKAHNIKIKAKAIIPSKLPFKDIDLCSLITNILDNAMENCDPSCETPIMFTILKQQDFIRIYCENTVDNKTSKNLENGSTKKEKGHGYGLKIIKNIAKNYDGYAYFENNGDKYITDVLLEIGESIKNV